MAVSKDPFNKELDKITQAEVVYDFVERLSIGRDFNVGNYTFPANSKLRDKIIRKLYNLLPQSLVATLDQLNDTGKHHINKGDTIVLCGFMLDYREDEVWLDRIISDRTGIDISSAFEFEYVGKINEKYQFLLSAHFDTPYPYDDDISIYTKHKVVY